MKAKKHLTPEFQVIRQNEANAKFFVASGEFSAPNNATTYVFGSTSEW